MKFSITLVAMAVGAFASPTPSALFRRQDQCAAVNQGCLSPALMNMLVVRGDAIESVPGYSLEGTMAALTCCDGLTCTGDAAPLPGSLAPLEEFIGGLPYQSCTDDE